jgi:hypothetical protein
MEQKIHWFLFHSLAFLTTIRDCILCRQQVRQHYHWILRGSRFTVGALSDAFSVAGIRTVNQCFGGYARCDEARSSKKTNKSRFLRQRPEAERRHVESNSSRGTDTPSAPYRSLSKNRSRQPIEISSGFIALSPHAEPYPTATPDLFCLSHRFLAISASSKRLRRFTCFLCSRVSASLR